ncbi:MAG: hypothetical protein AAFU41_00765 [Pseudomonadota bacterium]
MSAIIGFCKWGWGVLSMPAHEGVRGNTSINAYAEQVDDDEPLKAVLDGVSAKEAIESVVGELFDGNIEDLLTEVTFPGPIAEEFYWSNGDVIGIQGPVGSGKTTTLMKSRLRRAIEMPRSVIDGVRRYKVLFIRETYRQLWSTTIPSYLETFPKHLGDWSGGRGDPVTHRMRFEDEHGPIEFVAEFMAFGDDIVASMRGVQTTDIVLNEMDTMPVEILTVGIGRIDRWPAREHFAGLPLNLRSYGQIVGDFNAPDEENFTFNVFHNEEERQRMSDELSSELPQGVDPIRILFFLQPGYGEPGCENTKNLSPTYYPRQIASMKLAGRGDMIDRLVYNKITYLRVGDPVFLDHFNRRIHVSNETLKPIPGIPLRIGLDQGFKAAAVVCQFVPFRKHGYWRFYAELHFPKKRLLAKAFGDELRDLLDTRFSGWRVEAGWADMAGEAGSSVAEDENENWNSLCAAAADITIRPQIIGANRIGPRLEAMRAALDAPLMAGNPGLLLDPSMKFAIAGFTARYVWTDEVTKNGDKRKIPDKQYTEANVIDGMQYVLMSEHLANGLSPISVPEANRMIGHNGGPSMHGNQPPGIDTSWDITNPYGS